MDEAYRESFEKAEEKGVNKVPECPFCRVKMVVSKELTKDGEYYSDRYTCKKCGHWERGNFQWPNLIIENEV